MGVIDTRSWLKENGNQPLKICEKLTFYFKGNTAREIYDYLSLFGMYRNSIFAKGNNIECFIDQDYWKIVKKEYDTLRMRWKGPDIPIIILPVNERKLEIMREYNGKSGIAFSDKIILFLASDLAKAEVKALLTHEYSHVCRLKFMSKREDEITLLDTIILEGLAELAVKEHCGSEFVANWSQLYSNEQLQKWWKELVYPNRNKHKDEEGYQEILYGLKTYPKMLGYCIGYFLIERCIEEKQLSLENIEKKDAKQIIQLLTFKEVKP